MEPVTEYRLHNHSSAVPAARRALDNQRELEPYPEIRVVAQLLASELVANTIRHANLATGETFLLRLECDRHLLHVDVADDGRGFNPLAHIARYVRTGSRKHGLYLVNALADRWGYRQHEGSTVWFEIDLLPGRRPWQGRSSASEGYRA